MNSVTIFSHDGRLLCDHDDPSPARSREAVRAPARRDSEWEPGAPDASSPDDEVRMTPQRSAVATAFLRQRSLPPAQSQRAGSGGRCLRSSPGSGGVQAPHMHTSKA